MLEKQTYTKRTDADNILGTVLTHFEQLDNFYELQDLAPIEPIASKRSTQDIERLVAKNAKLAAFVIRKQFPGACHPYLEFGDMWSAALLGLYKSAKSYNQEIPKRDRITKELMKNKEGKQEMLEIKFATYSSHIIANEIRQLMRKATPKLKYEQSAMKLDDMVKDTSSGIMSSMGSMIEDTAGTLATENKLLQEDFREIHKLFWWHPHYRMWYYSVVLNQNQRALHVRYGASQSYISRIIAKFQIQVLRPYLKTGTIIDIKVANTDSFRKFQEVDGISENEDQYYQRKYAMQQARNNKFNFINTKGELLCKEF